MIQSFADAPLTPARVRLGVLTLTCLLPVDQDEVWRRITQPELLAQWSPVVPDRPLDAVGPATSREQEGDEPVDAAVTDVRALWFLEHAWGSERLTWQLAPSGAGTQLNLVHEPSDPQQIPGLAAGWHLCLTVLGRQLAGIQTERCVGSDALDHGWEELRERYAELLEVAPA
ncbi:MULTISPECIES: SRPBCC domain-containing protein [unclassified Luteococcus]|uniref:SRPBCC domain-containing protein n=1 Tax=unclassified Luteococcus TaxID=2639923 RepID=UPI00313DB844